MSEKMKTFLEAVSKDQELTKKVNAMTDKADIMATAKELGFELTEADFETQNSEMSEDELNAVAGGGTCACVLGGGGTKDDYDVDQVCACVITGLGLDCDGIPRCICEVGGGGKAFLDD